MRLVAGTIREVDLALVGAGLGGCAVTAAFTALGAALMKDYRGVTTWHVERTVRLTRRSTPERFDRQYRLERQIMGPTILAVGLLSLVGALVAVGMGLTGG